jgi:hypothetical protein
MKFVTKAHRQGDIILNEERFSPLYKEIVEIISSISDEDIKTCHASKYPGKMSLSHTINSLLKVKFIEKGWVHEAPIFQEEGFQSNKWRLDFAKDLVSVEVAFNHGEAIAWNLLKPVLASELNHVKKAIQSEVGVVICATKALKIAGAFDSAVGEFEKICRYLRPLNNVLSVPMVIIGLEPPESFKMTKNLLEKRNIGQIIDL